MIVDETLDIDNKVFDVAKTPAPDRSLCDDVEPDLHLDEPRAIGGCIVHMIPLPCRQPGTVPWRACAWHSCPPPDGYPSPGAHWHRCDVGTGGIPDGDDAACTG